MSRWKQPLIAVGATASGLIIASAIGLVLAQSAPAAVPAEPAASPAPTVTIATATRTEFAHSLSLIGSVVARNEVQLGFDVPDGYRIVEVDADQGDEVKAGQILARLATDRIDIQLAQNAATILKDEAAIAQAKSLIAQMQSAATEASAALARANALGIGNVITQQIMDQRISAANAANAQVASAQAGLSASEAERALAQSQRSEHMLTKDKTTIRSPCDGVVLSRAAQVGQVVSGATGAMFRIARGGEFEAAVQVDEASLLQVKPGQTASVALADGSNVTGSVRSISREVDKANRLAEVRIALDHPAAMSSGMFARADVETERHEGVVVPSSSIVFEGEISVVRVISGGKVQSRVIDTGIVIGAGTEITHGVAAGETIIRRAGAFVHDGQIVTAVAGNGD
jgi:HlyD family secretion protein